MSIRNDCFISIIAIENFAQIISLLTITEYGRLAQVCKSIPSLEDAPLFLKQKAIELRLNLDGDRGLVELFKRNMDVIRGLRNFLSGGQTKKEFGSWLQLMMIRNQPLLFKTVLDGTVHFIPNVEVRRERTGVPRNLRQKDFLSAFRYSASHGHTGCLKEMLEHPWFHEIEAVDFGEVARETASEGQLDCLGLLLTSERFQELNPLIGEIALAAAENGHASCLQLVLSDGRFDPLQQEDLTDLVQRTVVAGQGKCLEMLMTEGWFDQISTKNVELMAGLAASYGKAGCLEIITESHRFREVRRKSLGQVFIAATFSGKEECLKPIIDSGRFQDIRKKDLMKAFDLARLLGYKTIFLRALLKTNKYKQ